MKKTLLVDFDATLSNYKGWRGPTELDPPLPSARKAMILLSRDYKLVCFTTRARDEDGANAVKQWLKRWGFPQMEVTAEKKPAHLIIDDRALLFAGQWTDELLAQIRSFTPHWEETPHRDDSCDKAVPLTPDGESQT